MTELDRKFEITRADGIETIQMKGVHYTRIIHGIASTERPCTSAIGNKMSLSADGCMAKLPIPLMSQHAKELPIGEVYLLRKGGGQIYVRAGLNESRAANYIWSLIGKGDVRCFSVLAGDQEVNSSFADGYRFVDRWQLKEISVCRKGANADCHFEILQ